MQGAQSFLPSTSYRNPVSETQPEPIVYRLHPYRVGLSLDSGAGLPTRHFNFRRWMPISAGTIREGSKGLSPQESAAFLTFAAAWLTAHRRLFYCFLCSSTHIHLWLIKPACSEKDCALGRIATCACLLVQQLNVIILEVSASRALNSVLFFCASADFHSS